MKWIEQIGSTGAGIFLGLVVVVLVLTLLVGSLYLKVRKLDNAYRRTFRKGRGKYLEQLILESLSDMHEATQASLEATAKVRELEAGMARCIQNVGMVRYRAFQNAGPDLSFSLALLDANRDGMVLTNIFGGTNCSMYSKPVKDGKSEFLLSLEEKEALEIAMSDKPMKIPEPVKKTSIPSLIASVVTNNILAPKN
ncbi:hypothetical protein ABB02_00916 [Clostridiaceae bacterium JG1575]|nr:hypothetical protein ABB02_00916 [Clostridiaceae bacterium JG1575]